MHVKMAWRPYYDGLRQREFVTIFSGCPAKVFRAALELGAGRGLQTRLLTQAAATIISTDLNPNILDNEPTPSIQYAICDAETVASQFATAQFDLVYSSNLLEHVPNVQTALQGLHQVLRDDGIMIHVMPSPFWKLCHVCFYLPNQAIIFLEKVTEPGGLQKLARKIRGVKDQSAPQQRFGNNPKTQRKPRSLVHRLLLPKPHGVSENNLKELYAFSMKRWQQEFTRANLKVVKVKKGPVFSGYSFGLNHVRRILEDLGFTSEYIYIVVKDGHDSPYQQYF
jgi:SAM-dependent methyltransferase